MEESKRTDLSVRQENALLVGVKLPHQPEQDDPLAELESLARTAGARVAGTMRHKLKQINPGYYIGHGKAEQIRDKARALDADVVIFDNDLSPAQIRDLEELIGCKVLDRSELILDIFATRAKTHQARLAVELAQLEYTFPRLRRMWTHLDTIAGGATSAAAAVGGIGTRGPGETQIETDRRIVRRRIGLLKRKLAEIGARRTREVAARREQFTVSLVGYTNAGKSSLLNALTGAGAFVEDKLFATLDTKTVQWKLAPGRIALLSDTVGFVRDLPHHLIASFRATLEEATHADLLLHVVDAASPDALGQVETVERVLAELGLVPHGTGIRGPGPGGGERETSNFGLRIADCRLNGEGEQVAESEIRNPKSEIRSPRAMLLALNKIDAIEDLSVLHVLADRYPGAVQVSARTGRGLDLLAGRVLALMQGQLRRLAVRVPLADGKLLGYLEAHAEQVHDRRYDASHARIELTLASRWLNELARFDGRLEIEPGSNL